MPAVIRRGFGLKTDPVAGGSEYDDLTAGAIDDADTFWPVNTGNLERGITRTTREEEVRGRRAAAPPLPFQAAPVMTVATNAYPSLFKQAAKYTLGGTPTSTGTAPAAKVWTYPPLGFGS